MAGKPISSLEDGSSTGCSWSHTDDICHSHRSPRDPDAPGPVPPSPQVFLPMSPTWPLAGLLAPPYGCLGTFCLTPDVPLIEYVVNRAGNNWENSRETLTNLIAKRTLLKGPGHERISVLVSGLLSSCGVFLVLCRWEGKGLSYVCECHLLMDRGGLSSGSRQAALSQGPEPCFLLLMYVGALAAICCPIPPKARSC